MLTRGVTTIGAAGARGSTETIKLYFLIKNLIILFKLRPYLVVVSLVCMVFKYFFTIGTLALYPYFTRQSP